jgi:hypothetical protein
MNDFKIKLIQTIGTDSFESWFSPQLPVFEGIKEKYKAREAVKFHSPMLGILVVEAHSRFFKQEIIKRFGEKINNIAKELGYSKAYVIIRGEKIGHGDRPLTREEWRKIEKVLSKIRIFRNSLGIFKASEDLFSFDHDNDFSSDSRIAA